MNWPERTPSHWRWIALAAAVPCLIVGIWLIASFLRSGPPDPAVADPDRVIRFVMSRGFDRLSEVERQRYVTAMMQQYATLNEQQRQQVDQVIRSQYESDGDRFRQRMFQMWSTYVVGEARTYVQVPPEEREAWMQQRIASWQLMGAPMGGPRRDGQDRPRDGRDRQASMELTPERQERAVKFFQNEILPRSSAEERALVALMFHDAARQFRERDR